MNNLNILTAPIYALFSRQFYRQVLKAPLSRGFLYLLYLSVLMTLFFYVMILTAAIPQINPLVDWVKQEMPPLVGTPQGFQMGVPSPYVMVHPDFGPLVTFDMNASGADEKTMGNVPVLITSTKIFIKAEGTIRTIDLFSPEAQKNGTQIPANVRVDGALIGKIYQTLRFWILLFLFIILIPMIFLMQLVFSLLCSLLGLVFNMMRVEKLDYSAILNVAFFASTASTIYGVAKAVVPFMNFLPGGLLVSFLLTGVYLFIFLKWDEVKPV